MCFLLFSVKKKNTENSVPVQPCFYEVHFLFSRTLSTDQLWASSIYCECTRSHTYITPSGLHMHPYFLEFTGVVKRTIFLLSLYSLSILEIDRIL